MSGRVLTNDEDIDREKGILTMRGDVQLIFASRGLNVVYLEPIEAISKRVLFGRLDINNKRWIDTEYGILLVCVDYCICSLD